MWTPTFGPPQPAPGSCRPSRQRSRCSGDPGGPRPTGHSAREKSMSEKTEQASSIRNIAEEPWQEFPAPVGAALSKALVRPATVGSRQIDYRISPYRPMASVKTPTPNVTEQVYHFPAGEGPKEIDR